MKKVSISSRPTYNGKECDTYRIKGGKNTNTIYRNRPSRTSTSGHCLHRALTYCWKCTMWPQHMVALCMSWALSVLPDITHTHTHTLYKQLFINIKEMYFQLIYLTLVNANRQYIKINVCYHLLLFNLKLNLFNNTTKFIIV